MRKATKMVTEYKRVRRVVLVPCGDCLGSGYLATKHGAVRCPHCVNGDVQRVVNEIVHELEQEGGGA